MATNSEPRLDPEQAHKDAQRKPLGKGAAPHYMRCDWYSGTRRCKLADGHPKAHDWEEEDVT